MPKRNVTVIQLPAEKPDRCKDCPLVGLIPKNQIPKGSKETHVCMGTHEALTGRGIKVRASGRDSHHPLRRPCDSRWEAWMQIPGRRLGVGTAFYLQTRIPYEQNVELPIKFHR